MEPQGAHERARVNIAAVDLGAESGRVVLARFDGATLELGEAHRFANTPLRAHDGLRWNAPLLRDEALRGLRAARALAGAPLASVGVDSWAVDYGLVDDAGELLDLPFHYRDARTNGVMDEVFARVPRERVYARTGIQMLPFNTLYQLVAHQRAQPEQLRRAARLLMIPDLLHTTLCGRQVGERTNASTTQMWAVAEHRWATDLLEALDLPLHLLPSVVEPGEALGPLRPELAGELGAGARVVAPATHDTGSAVAATPGSAGGDWAYISSGTWSLVGLELPRPLLGPDALAANFTNEGGVFGTTRFLKNVMGLWLVQECRRAWERAGQTYSYDELFALADAAPAFACLIDPDDPRYLPPGEPGDEMPDRIAAQARERGQRPPESVAAYTRCILESLTLRYRQTLETAARLANTSIAAIHIMGGGSQSALVNSWLADATGLPVVAGPVEATAMGNALMQLVALGELSSLAEARRVSLASTRPVTYLPRAEQRQRWDDVYGQFSNQT